MRAVILATLFIFLWTAQGFCASFNFKASENNLVKDMERVVFTFTYDPEDGEPADKLEIRLDYYGDRENYKTWEFEPQPGTTLEHTYTMVYEKAGYFDAEATFFLTWEDENGETETDSEDLGPVRINVANWKFSADGTLGCIESTPAVSGDGRTVYVGSEDGNLYAVYTRQGYKKWLFSTNGPVSASPALDAEGNIYFGSEDGHVYCLEPEAGAMNWQFPAAGQPGRGHFFSSPALDEDANNLYIGSADNFLYALSMDNGETKWQFRTDAKIISSPVIGHDQTIYIGSLDGFLYALNPDGSEKWRYDAGCRIEASPALDQDGSIYVGTSGFRGEVNDHNGLHAITLTGKKKWFKKNINGFPAAPIITEPGIVVVGSYNNNLHGINRSGKRFKRYSTFSDDLVSSPAFGTYDYIYAGSKDGSFIGHELRKFDQGDKRELWKYQLPHPITASSPVIDSGFLYFGTCDYDHGALFSLFGSEGGKNPPFVESSPDSPWPHARNGSANTGKTSFTPETIAPAITSTNPAPGAEDLNLERKSISATFSMPMEPSSIYRPPMPENDDEGFYGFTVEPFEAPEEDFAISWNEEKTRFTLTLPEDVSFEPDTEYTASILSRAHAEGDKERSILYTYDWNFSNPDDKGPSNAHDAWSCFVSTLFE